MPGVVDVRYNNITHIHVEKQQGSQVLSCTQNACLDFAADGESMSSAIHCSHGLFLSASKASSKARRTSRPWRYFVACTNTGLDNLQNN